MAFGLGAILSGIGKGASAAGKGIFSGIKKVPRLLGGEDGNADEMAFTPGFNPAASSPTFKSPQIAGARNLLYRPGQDDAQPSPMMDRPSPLKPANIRPKPLEYPSPMMRNVDEGAPITPQSGSPTFRRKSPYEELRDAKVEYNQGYKPPTGLGDRLKRGILPAISGFIRGGAQTGDLTGAISGAAGGFGGATLAPRQTYEAEFDRTIKPQILERQKAEREEGLFQDARRRAGLEDQYKQAQIQQEQRQTAGMPSAEESRMDRESQRKARDAQATAQLRGTPQKTQLDDGSGQLWEVMVYPDGNQEWLGLSGQATIKEADRTSREKIAKERNESAMARTQATQGAITARQKAGGGAKGGKKYVSITDIREYAKKHNISESQATAKARQEGYTPVR